MAEVYTDDLARQVESLTAQLEEARRELRAKQARLERLEIDGPLEAALQEQGIKPGSSLQMAMAKAKGVFRYDQEGKVKPLNDLGNVVTAPRSLNPLTMRQFAQGLRSEVPELFGDRTEQQGNAKTVSKDDLRATSRNLAAIANGEVVTV